MYADDIALVTENEDTMQQWVKSTRPFKSGSALKCFENKFNVV